MKFNFIYIIEHFSKIKIFFFVFKHDYSSGQTFSKHVALAKMGELSLKKTLMPWIENILTNCKANRAFLNHQGSFYRLRIFVILKAWLNQKFVKIQRHQNFFYQLKILYLIKRSSKMYIVGSSLNVCQNYRVVKWRVKSNLKNFYFLHLRA